MTNQSQKPKLIIAIVPFLLLLAFPGLQSQEKPGQHPIIHSAKRNVEMGQEEKFVRTTYAKLSFAARLSVLWHAVSGQGGWPKLDDQFALEKALTNQIRFDLTDFKVGDLSDIGDHSWTTLIEGPVGVIGVSSHTVPFAIVNKEGERKLPISYAEVFWSKKASSPEYLSSEHKLPTVNAVLAGMHGANRPLWLRYASFSVVATLDEKTVTYRAAFLFSANDADVLPLDYAMGMGPASFMRVPMYPSALVDSAFREIPFIQGWIVSSEIVGCKKFKQPEVCCDPATGRCGIAGEDLQKSMEVPIDPDEREILDSRFNTSQKGRKK